MPDAGDSTTATLTVDPHDGTTAVTLTVTAPNGTTTTPATSSSGGGATWTATVTYTVAGVWTLTWVVTGTGAGTEHQRVAVGPSPVDTGAGRVYATSTDLANHLRAAPPTDADRKLREASRLLDSEVFRFAWYDVDDDGMPTNAKVIAAFKEAACAQVEFWQEVGEETDTSGPLQGVTIGSVNLQFGAGDNRSGPTYIAPRVHRALRDLTSEEYVAGMVCS